MAAPFCECDHPERVDALVARKRSRDQREIATLRRELDAALATIGALSRRLEQETQTADLYRNADNGRSA